MLLQSLQMGLELFFVLEWSNREILPQHSTRSISSRRRIRGGRKRNLLGHHREKQRREHHHAQRHPQAPTTEQFFFVVIYGCSIIVVVVVVHRKKKRESFSLTLPLTCPRYCCRCGEHRFPSAMRSGPVRSVGGPRGR